MDLLPRLYHKLLLIRQFEKYLAEIYHTDAIKSPVHLSIGQEAVAVGICDALQTNDVISNTYRCHAGYIAKGGDLNTMMAELYGKATGCAGGKAGSMHLVDIPHGILGASAVVGTTVPLAAGYAWALKQEAQKTGQQRVVVCFFGDGATEEGAFYETLNFAKLHTLPILFVCENNGLAIHSRLHQRWATEDICQRVSSFGIETHQDDGRDILALRSLTESTLAKLRNAEGPQFFECKTYRWMEHVGPTDDHHEAYRDHARFEAALKNDPLTLIAAQLDDITRQRIEQQVRDEIKAADDFAKASAYPQEKDLYTHVYA